MQFSTILSAALLVISPIYAGSNPSSFAAVQVKKVTGIFGGSATQAGEHSAQLINAGTAGANDAARLAASHLNGAEGLTHAAANPLNLEHVADIANKPVLKPSASMAALSAPGESVAAPLERSFSSPAILAETVPVGSTAVAPAAINAAVDAGTTAEKGGAGSWIRNMRIMNPFGKKSPAEPKEFGQITEAEAGKIAADKAVRNGKIQAGLIGGGVGLATGGLIAASVGSDSQESVNVIQPAGAVQGNSVPGTF